jgi:hypothetical protein
VVDKTIVMIMLLYSIDDAADDEHMSDWMWLLVWYRWDNCDDSYDNSDGNDDYDNDDFAADGDDNDGNSDYNQDEVDNDNDNDAVFMQVAL